MLRSGDFWYKPCFSQANSKFPKMYSCNLSQIALLILWLLVQISFHDRSIYVFFEIFFKIKDIVCYIQSLGLLSQYTGAHASWYFLKIYFMFYVIPGNTCSTKEILI